MALLENMLPATADVSRCGEIFVTNNADKWTFVCSYCQKATTDIGVFICHIRLDHLNDMQYSQQQSNELAAPPEAERNFNENEESQHAPSVQDERIFPRDDVQEIESNLLKEETLSVKSERSVCNVPVHPDVSSLLYNNHETKNIFSASSVNDPAVADVSPPLPDDRVTENVYSNENDIQMYSYISSDETNEEFLDILPIGEDSQQQELATIDENNEAIQVVYRNDDEIIDIDDEDIDEILDSEAYIENNDGAHTASGSMVDDPNNTLEHVCQYCMRTFKSIRGLHFHKTQVHNEKYHKQLKYKCKLCKRGFKTLPGLRDHRISHDKNKFLQCPVCPVKKFRINGFLHHVMKHESNNCFPCQTCGNVYESNTERLTHWETHSKDKPYTCEACYRRFSHKHYLIHHLKKHGQYSCYFCPQHFLTDRTLRIPYVCPNCEKLPDIKQKIQQQKLASYKNQAYESDEE